ncbi:GumC family protein [Martelella endophytica]|uniref:non-specific protein-tyrosine kinase n=1 Tax=Martelella endophytica TaxID=1486262 RepID=A0A0D5LN63_MAREN|nr:polysaccharide biosynthesis tyrosine autokinase [Martelella endophytica]AJY45365.1 hypothetical protein TM49_06105 [Martelella endophytica]
MRDRQEYIENDEIDLGKLFSLFWRGKFIILAVTLCFAAVGFYYAFFVTKPIYSASSVVMLNSQAEQVIDLPSVISQLTSDDTVIQTEIQVMRSRILAGNVVDTLDLTADPEFNSSLREVSLISRMKAAILGSIGARPQSDAPVPSDAATHDRVVDSLLNAYSVSVVPNTTAFRITVLSEDAAKAAEIADTIAKQYVQSQIDVKRDATVQAINWLTDQVSELKISLENSENAVKNFKTETPMISPEVLTGLERQLKSVRDRVAENKRNLAESTALLERLASAEGYDGRAEAAGDALLSDLARRAPRDPAAAAQFETRFQTILTDARSTVQRSQEQLNVLETSEQALETRIKTESDASVELEQLTREAEANRTLYEYFLARLKETSAQQGIQQADSRIISYSVQPVFPAKPNKKLIVLLSAMLGFGAGSGLVLLMEMRHKTFRSSQEIEEATGLPVLGQIPLIAGKGRRDVLTFIRDNPTSPVTESVRNLRTSVLLGNIDKPPQVLVTTSAIPGEGKTTTGAALALNFVGMGKKVLLIEGDLRRLSLDQYFSRPKTLAGVISVLTGRVALEEAVWHSEEHGLDVLFGEKSEANAADVLSSERMRTLLDEARARYDVIVIDTPPALIVPDARVVSQFVDMVLFVVKWDSTHQQQVEEAIRLFEDKVIGGVVLNQIDPNGFKRYGYSYGYGYGYAAHYDDKYYLSK